MKQNLLTGIFLGGIAAIGLAGCAQPPQSEASVHAGPTSFDASPMSQSRLGFSAPLSDPAADGMAAPVIAKITPVDAHGDPTGDTQALAVFAPRIGSAEAVSPAAIGALGLRAYQLDGNDGAMITGPARLVHYTVFVRNGGPGPVQISGEFSFPARAASHAGKSLLANLNGRLYSVKISASVPKAASVPRGMPSRTLRFPDE
ncbi:MAG: hypothetical protein KGL63_09750 [Betaproteobacteria bacterium]|uniref:hypothetical protein n=1 Tax=Acidiphilium multivorum TaxID=62140 RepID=UPI001F4C184B|nr:hypothetical protein [Acidiphilium multivorum]MDE2343653.1 hypothetical protein [Betaproteobacteria bacterium]UNC16187.1 hypothetical protein FE249_18195 [Acidiphilium multivorum]